MDLWLINSSTCVGLLLKYTQTVASLLLYTKTEKVVVLDATEKYDINKMRVFKLSHTTLFSSHKEMFRQVCT